MSSVLHPVGPEPEERYWVRRIAVLAAALVALVVIVALAINATRAGSAVQAAPAPPPPIPAALPTSPAPSSATPPVSPAATASPATPAPSPADRSTDPGSTSAAGAAVRAGTERLPTPARTTPARPTKKAATTKTPVLPACPVDELRTTLTGKRSLGVQRKATFDLSLINGSGRSCYLRVTAENFSLTIVSGRDRIWSSKDCGKTVPTLSRKLGPEQAAQATMTWNGRRSAQGCRHRPETPRPGTYWAIAQFDDAKPVRLRMVLHA